LGCGIGGTGSQFAAFRLERDVFARKPDLVFIDFTINDDAYAEFDEALLNRTK
jgi:acyl-CoA thioesterase I